MSSERPWAGLAFALCVGACGGEPAGEVVAAWSVRDSAGVEIVEVVRPAWPVGGAWTVSPEPVLEIGAAEGEEAYQLFRVSDAVRLPDGSIVVANRGTNQIRWFDAEGRFVRNAGGPGGGPGEFDSLYSLRLAGDTVFAHDLRLSRVTAFSLGGELLGTIQLERRGGLPIEVWPVAGGFLASFWDSGSDVSEDLSYGRRRTFFVRHDATGAFLDTLDAIPGPEMITRGGPAGGGFVMMSADPLVSYTSLQTVVEGRLVAASTDRFEVRVYGGGRLERLIRDPGRDLPLTRDEWDKVLAARLAEAESPDQRRNVLQMADLRPAPATRPAFARFVPDRTGFLWVEPWRPDGGGPVPWLVIDPDGPVLGAVDLPSGLRPTDIGEDWVLGVVRDEFDVERLRLHRLRRGG